MATVGSVPFNQDSGTQNKIKFKIDYAVGNTGESDEYTVNIDAPDPTAPMISPPTNLEGDVGATEMLKSDWYVWLIATKKWKINNMKRSTILILSAVLIAAILSGCVQELSDIGSETPDMAPTSQPNVTASPTPTPTSKGATPTQSVPSTGMEVDLSISNAPALNQTAELTCTITSISDAYNTTAQITLPEGLVLVSGNLYWTGDIIVPEAEKRKHPRPPLNGSGPEWEQLWEEYTYPKGTTEFSVIIKSIKAGNWTIAATAGYEAFTQEGVRYGRLGDSDYAHLAVREDTAWISETLFTTEGPAPARQLNVTPTLLPVEHSTEDIITPEPIKPPSVPPTGMEVNLYPLQIRG